MSEEVYREAAIRIRIMNHKDLAQELLGKCAAIQESEADLMAMIADNPCGNGTQLTPMVLIREVKD